MLPLHKFTITEIWLGQQLWCTMMFCFLSGIGSNFWTQSFSNSGWSSSTSAFWTTTDLNRNTVTDVWKHTLLSVSKRGNSTGPEYKHTKNLLITRWVVTWYLCPSPFKRKNGCTTTTKNSTPGVWWWCYRAACIKAASIRKYERWTYSPPPETSHLICMCDFAFAAHGGCDPRLWPEQFSVTEYAQMCSS